VPVKRLVLASALALLALRGGAAAQPAPAAPSVNAKAARDHFKAGERLIKQQKFAEAISELEQAYKLDPQTEHLYNLGVAHHLGGDDSIAIEYYRLYLLDAPAGTTARAAAGYLSSLEKKLVDARDKKIRQDLADAQARAAQAGTTQDSVELLLYAQYIADAEAKERKVQVLDDEIQANEAEITAQDQRRTGELEKAQRATEQAKKWENHARKAPSGGGRKRRIAGLILLGAGAAGVTMGAHEYYSRTSSPENLAIANHSGLYAIAGGTSLLLGLVFVLAGENASKAPRPDSTFRDIQLLPAVGREGGGLSLTARF
jgi:hypothetical protein